MYYIVNETNQMIAADESLLQLCHLKHINHLNSDIILKNIHFTLNTNNQLTIKTPKQSYTYRVTKIPLSTLLGELILIEIHAEEVRNEASTKEDIAIENLIIKQDKTHDEIHIITDIAKEVTHEPVQAPQNKKMQEDIPHPLKEKETLVLDKEIYIDITQVSQNIGVCEEDYLTFLNEYISTALDMEKDLQSDDPKLYEPALNTLSHLNAVLHLDAVGTITDKIKETHGDLRLSYVSDFYDALSRITTSKHNKDANSDASENTVLKKEEHIVLPTHTDETLHSPIETIELDKHLTHTDTTVDTEDKEDMLLDLGLDIEPKMPSVSQEKIDQDKEKLTLDLDAIPHKQALDTDTPEIPEDTTFDLDIKKEEATHETIKAETTINRDNITSFGNLDLSQVEPIPFDFSLHTAAEELALPESLIEEFMIDFVAQAHVETDKMLEAYKKGDLGSIQKIGHLLKGVSSNLRITTLSDTLYKIQFCDTPDNLEALIKDYWGHFLTFEKQINLLSK